MSYLVGLTKHGKEEVKFVNCTEIQAAHFRGQLWYQIILMQTSSPSGWVPVVHRGHGGRVCFRSCDPPGTHSPSALPGRHPAAREGGHGLLELGRDVGPAPQGCPGPQNRVGHRRQAQGWCLVPVLGFARKQKK